jgi:hypothetical protein
LKNTKEIRKEMIYPMYETLNPRGVMPAMNLTPSAPGLSDLKDKVVYVINIGKPYADGLLGAIADLLSDRFPSVKVVRVMKKTAYYSDEPELWNEVKEQANAVIIGPKD